MDETSKSYILMIIATVLWAGAFIAGKLGINAFSPLILTYLRIGLAAVIIFPVMVYKHRHDWKLNKEDYMLVIILGIVGMTGYHLLFFEALKYTTASNASVINSFNPLITAVLASIILKEVLSMKKIALILSAFLGVVLTITRWDLIGIVSHGFNKGDLIMLLAATCWATYSIIVKKGMQRISPLKLTTYTFIACVIILTPFAIKEIIVDQALDVPGSSYLAIIYMAIFPTVGGYTIQQYCIKTLGPSKTALFINLVPIFSIMMAVVFLGETFYTINVVSIILVIISVFLFLKDKAPKQQIYQEKNKIK